MKKNILSYIVFTGINALLFFSCSQTVVSKEEFEKQYNKEFRYFQPVIDMMNKRSFTDVLLSIDSLYKTLPHKSTVQGLVYLISKSIVYENKGDNDFYLSYIDSAITLIEKKHLQKPGAECYSNVLLQKASLLFTLHQPEKANELFFYAQQFSKQHNSITVQFSVAEQLAYIAYRQKNYRQALASFKESYALHQLFDQKDFYKKAESLDNIALCFYKLHNNDSAIVYYKTAIGLLEAHKNNIAPYISGMQENRNAANKSKGVVLGNLALIYRDKRKLDTAIILSNQSIAVTSVLCCEQRNAQLVQMRLIDMYHEKLQWNKMYAELQSLRKGLDSLPNTEPELNWNRQMADYYDAIGRPEKAFTYLKSFKLMEDSLNMVNQKDEESNIVKDLQLKNQESDLKLLKKDNQLNKLYLVITIGLILVALNIIAFVVVNYRKTRKTNIALTKLNEQISEQKTALERANRDKDKIMNVVAHDLRNPIGAIANFLDIVQVKYAHSEEEKKILNNSQQAAVRSINLINDLLEINKIQSGELELYLSSTNAVQLIKQSIQQVQYKTIAKQQNIVLNASIENAMINVDEEKLQRVLVNLLDNAIKFSFINATIEVKLFKKETNIIIEIKDTGMGIPASIMDKLFTNTITVKRKGTHNEPSNGLGLSICKQIVEAHKGKINVVSKEGEGSVFSVELPLS